MTPTSSAPSAPLSILRRPSNRQRALTLIDAELERLAAREAIVESEQRFKAEQGERASFDKEKSKCARDKAYWFNHWVWGYDPRLLAESKKPYTPFKLWPRQVKFLAFLDERYKASEQGVLEKSRDQGATYLCAGWALHNWLFAPGFKATFGSRDYDLVDKLGNPDAIFEKLRIMLRRLPAWMLPAGFDFRKHCVMGMITNPETGATLTGEAGDDMGRGGRSSIYFVDEAAFIARPASVEAAIAGNTDCVIWVSSVNPKEGTGNFFARKRHSGVKPRQVFRLYWGDDPRKTKAWGLAKKNSLSDPTTWEAEYEINYSASSEGVCIPAAWVRSAQQLGSLEPELPRAKLGISGGDVGGGKALSVVIHRFGPIVSEPEARQEADTTDTADWMLESCHQAGSAILHYDNVGIGAGVASRLNKSEEYREIARVGINTGVGPSDTVWNEGTPSETTSEDMFGNLKAEIWWLARHALQRTHLHVLWLLKQEGGIKQHLNEIVALGEDATLATQLSIPKWSKNTKGKIIIESKEQLAKRGITSPDYAEAFVLTFVPVPEDDISGIRIDVETFHRPNPYVIGDTRANPFKADEE